MTTLLIKNATLVNEGRIFPADVLIRDGRIEKIAPAIDARADHLIDAEGLHLLPGLIDDQVHFREPGLTHKADIASESRAALAGGTTTFMDMPNVNPPTVTLEALEDKHARAARSSWINYSFYLGATNDNIEEVKRLDPRQACGVKIFMGSSTGNMLVDRDEALRQVFRHSPTLIATHCEDTPMIQAREAEYRARYGDEVPFSAHAEIRCREACYKSSAHAVALAKETGAQLHILHITTAEELSLFTPGPVRGKQITAEACVHHLWFCGEADYAEKGSLIKCNPAIKACADRDAIRQAVIEGRIDVIATDHAPHTLEEKNQPYFNAPSGLPQVQRSLQALLDLYHEGVFPLELIQALQAEGHPIYPGAVGENLTVAGLDWPSLEVGAVLDVGEARLQLTQRVEPCNTIADAFADRQFKRIKPDRVPDQTRWYARVLTEGVVRPGDESHVAEG